MPTFGGFGGWPRRYGGGESPVETIYNSLNQARGTAYDTSDESNVTAETYAHAVVLAAVWAGNRRVAHAWDPYRMTDLIPRWEVIFGVRPSINASDNARRRVLQSKFRALANQLTLQDAVSDLIGDCLVQIEYTPLALAYQRWQVNSPTDDWISDTAHILIRVQYTSGQIDSDFLRLMAQMDSMLRQMLPAYTTWDWAMYAEDGTDNFYLDDPVGSGPPPNNLNYESFGE